MPYPHTAAPRHFSGQLTEKNLGCTHGLHQIALTLVDDDGGSHIVYIAHGRGAEAGTRAAAQYGALLVGAHYYGSGTLCRQGELHTHWMGAVQIEPCQRRHRFATEARAAA